MIGLKRLIRHGFVFSAVAHVGLLLGLLFVGAGAVQPVPPEPMAIEIVPASEAPPVETKHVDGTMLDSTSSGSEVSSDSEKGSANAAPPKPKSAMPSLQRSASLATAKPQTAAPPKPETQPQAAEPLLPPTTPTDEPQPHPKEAAIQPDVGEMFAMPLALPGGRLGGGFDAPAVNPAKLPHDDLAAFRARLTSCSHLASGSAMDDSAKILVRISFKRDGTLASPPKLLDATLSPDAAILMQHAITALERCQPFTELPADKYKMWKTLELVVTPLVLSGG